ncbi:SDR family oxidoreductase [Natribacillus halophilus]|uniref:NAD(P)-dependent dehydrogenase, short-chain alcohol dehydrogenase family n=1 Tax=Natribacillus halophilus TaxID=549003 RepID=A0A1G8J6W3_9BACI|nr:SDR family oxidoreductase [Natribacillus halophilus]SDI26841.1 NAD(P)-dependent dehydrogenase, short-chain alcohol dehydrogenase family [Natribacillus halophilus]
MFSVQDKSIIITGANSGIGKETAEVLAARGAHVTMASRSVDRGEEAKADILKRIPYAQLEVGQCDLSSLASVAAFAAAYQERNNKLYALINNAGVVTTRREMTEDGFEKMLGVNHIGHFYLTTQLLPLLMREDNARVITLSSGAYKWGDIDFADPHLDRTFGIWKGYARSKLANVLFTVELARRLKTSFVNAVSVHPGAASTEIGVDRETGFGKKVHTVLRPILKSSREGAATTIHLASTRELINGGYYYEGGKRQELKGKALDADLAKELWEWGEKEIRQRGF